MHNELILLECEICESHRACTSEQEDHWEAAEATPAVQANRDVASTCMYSSGSREQVKLVLLMKYSQHDDEDHWEHCER